jgi:amino acid transporter
MGKLTTLMTILSMSAIATNGKFRTGGAYFLTSRSLGPASGATIGLLYYIANTFSAGMSIIGAVETLQIAAHFHLGPPAFSIRFFSLIILGLMIVLNLFGRRRVQRAG